MIPERSSIGARLGSPLVVGLGKGRELHRKRRVGAVVAHTRDAVYINDYEVVTRSRAEDVRGGDLSTETDAAEL